MAGTVQAGATAAGTAQLAPMCLGLVATTDAAATHVLGLARAAVARGWACRCFLTDTGVRLLNGAALREMAQAGQLQLEVCEHAWQLFGGGPAPEGFKLRSQLQNAMLARDCDRVIVI
jgi:hypothetical protein